MKLAEMCDTATSYIGEIEIGRRFPSLALIEKIGRVLEIEPYRFFMNEPDISGELEETIKFLAKLPGETRIRIIHAMSLPPE
jgi:transcriptional regulator with XRE-family HTH domain